MAQPPALTAHLRDYQLRGLNWLADMTSLGLGGCLADDMGLGKTITLIALHLHRQSDPATAGPTLVVCPTSLMGNWQREIEKFAPRHPRAPLPRGRALPRHRCADGEFVLTTYGTMRLRRRQTGRRLLGHGRHRRGPAHQEPVLRDRHGSCAPSRPRARVALSGTPVENNLSELWAILDWTTPGPARPPRYVPCQVRVRRPRAARTRRPPNGSPGSCGPSCCAAASPTRASPPSCPPKTETDRAVSLTKEQTGLYEAVVRETLAEISGADGFERRGLVVKLLTALKQICNHPAQYLKEEDPAIAGRSGKLELLDELLDTIVAEDGAALVFTQYVRMARLIERHLAARGVPALFLHGGTPVERREQMVRDFQDGQAPVFLLSLKAAGTGLNLTRAGHVIHYDRWWNPAVEAQATDRAYRIGQTQPVQVHRLVAEGTVEDRIAEMLERKRELADAVLGSGESALTELSDAELTDLVALRGSGR